MSCLRRRKLNTQCLAKKCDANGLHQKSDSMIGLGSIPGLANTVKQKKLDTPFLTKEKHFLLLFIQDVSLLSGQPIDLLTIYSFLCYTSQEKGFVLECQMDINIILGKCSLILFWSSRL